MSQKCKENTKRPKPQHTQLGILKIFAFCWKIKQRALAPGESAARVTYVSVKTHLKSSGIIP